MSILFLFILERKKKKDISFIYLLSIYPLILSMNQVKRVRLFLGSPKPLDRFCQRNERGARSECLSDPEVLAKRIRCCSPPSVFSRFANLPL